MKFLLQEKQAGKNSDINDGEIVVVAGKLYKIQMHIYKTTFIFTNKMFKLTENYEVDRRILKCDYI